ncbi:MAG: hypothetical protein WDN31_17815 [Hyphomicrobium sp.]
MVLFAVGLAGLGFALEQLMTHADPNASLHAVAGIGAFLVAAFASIVIIR